MFVTQFENEEQSFRNRKNSTAVVVTILFHALILLLLVFTILQEPNPPLEELSGGTTVNFGTDDAGTGDEQPFTYNPGNPANSAAAPSQSAPTEAATEKLLTRETEENTVAVPKVEEKPKAKVNDKAVYKKPKKTNNNPTTASTTTAESSPTPVPQPQPNSNAMFHKGAYGAPNNSKSDGTGGGTGDQGKPNGDVNSHNYLGDGDGNGHGPGHGDLNGGASLKGRKNTTLPAPAQCSSQGKVVIAIKVDKNGKVIDATYKRFSSTAVDDCNITNAILAARKATFNPDPNAPEVQEGTITYIYKVH